MDSIRELLSRLPDVERRRFVADYVKQFCSGPLQSPRGSPAAMVRFVNEVDPDLLTPEIAALLAPGVLQHAPTLFQRLASKMDADARNRILDGAYRSLFPRTLAATDLYLNIRGVSSPFAVEAINMMASQDLSRALTYVHGAPKETRLNLLTAAYEGDTSRRINADEPIESLISAFQTAPPETLKALTEHAAQQLTLNNPYKALQLLNSYPGVTDDMWTIFFEKASLPSEELSSLLQEKLKTETGADLSTYSAAASHLIDGFARRDIATAVGAVEDIPDSETKDACIRSLMNVWGEVDPIAAMKYVRGLPASSLRDGAIAGLAPKLRFAADQWQDLLALTSSIKMRESILAAMQRGALTPDHDNRTLCGRTCCRRYTCNGGDCNKQTKLCSLGRRIGSIGETIRRRADRPR
ncbi:MAG: hypothetical protein WKF37_10450 [Bryobacteraceae bacterium]